MKLNASLLGVARAQLDICINVVKTSTILQNSEWLRRSGEQQKSHRLILSTCPPLKCKCKRTKHVRTLLTLLVLHRLAQMLFVLLRVSILLLNALLPLQIVAAVVVCDVPSLFKLLLKLAPLPEKACFKTNESLFHWFRFDSKSRWD